MAADARGTPIGHWEARIRTTSSPKLALKYAQKENAINRKFRKPHASFSISEPDPIGVRLNVRSGSGTMESIPGYSGLETLEYGKDNLVMRQAATRAPLGPIPLAVLAHARPFDLPPDKAEGFSSTALEAVLRAANANLAALVPNARYFVATESGHYIHQDRPELVTEAIREVVAAVRRPDTWYDLKSCCAK